MEQESPSFDATGAASRHADEDEDILLEDSDEHQLADLDQSLSDLEKLVSSNMSDGIILAPTIDGLNAGRLMNYYKNQFPF